jgi:chemotaxis protein MotA
LDLTLIIGIIVGAFLVIWGIIDGGGNLIGFYDRASIFITLGGTFASTFASFPFRNFKNMPKHILIALKKPRHDHKYYIDTIVGLAIEARKNGILSLEEKAEEIKDKFLSNCLMLIVDALDPEKTKELIQNEIDNLEIRHSNVWRMYDKASTYAPAYGMIGTLIGLINMLANLNMDAEEGSAALTQGMATALLTTLYGSLIANLVFMPISNKLRARHEEEVLSNMIIAEGVMAIQAGDNPRFIEQKLNAFLDEKGRNKKNKKLKKQKDENVEKGRNSQSI